MRPGRSVSVALALLALLFACPGMVEGQQSSEKAAASEAKRGYEAARRGYWQEANVRYESANRLRPNDPKILSNLAVSFEVIGDYDKARAAYERALDLAQNQRNIKRNFDLFEDFVRTYVDKKDKGEPASGDPEEKQGKGETTEAAQKVEDKTSSEGGGNAEGV